MDARNYTTSPHWRWNWDDLCGADGFKIWSGTTHDVGLCFQELCLQIPFMTILAVTSAYYFGYQVDLVRRGPVQLRAINFRCAIVTMLTILPIIHVYIVLTNDADSKTTIFYFLSVVQCLTWLTHLGYTLVLRNRLGLSARGPVFVCFIWTIIAVLNAIDFRSRVIIYKKAVATDFDASLSYGFAFVAFVLNVLYGLTLIPNEGDTAYLNGTRTYCGLGETQPLLPGNAYLRFLEDRDPNYLGVAMEESTWLSKLLFYWVNPLMQKGVEGKLTCPDDLYDVPDSLRSDTLSKKLERALIGKVDEARRQISERDYGHGSTSRFSSGYASTVPDVTFDDSFRQNVSLLRALHKCFGIQFYGIGVLKFAADCSGFAGPMLLNRLVGFIENKSEDIRMGYAYAGGLFSITLIAAFCNSHFNFLMSLVSLKIRAAIITTIYKKTLSVGGTVLSGTFSTGEIVNFMSTDTDRVVNSCPSFHALWSIPFQIAVTLYLLYNQLGLAFLAGVGFTIILIPINKIIANKIGSLSTKMMAQKDIRVKVMTEILRGIKSIKLHVWEDHFIKLVGKFRDSEMKYLKGRKYLDALCVYFWATTPVLISILTFVTYVLLGNKLTAATVFTSIALLNMLIGPLNSFPWVLNGLTEAWVSMKRIQKLLDLPDMDLKKYYDDSDDHANSDLVIKDGEFSWGRVLTAEERAKLHTYRKKSVKDKGKGKKSKNVYFDDSPERNDNEIREFYLSGINLNVKKGEFIGIIGNVGSGKSSMFSAILAELTKQSGRISISNLDNGFAFVSQQPWLQRGTIKDNILFGKTYDENKYNEVVNACCLIDDLAILPAGDLTGIGEGGMTLSGGQKARIALARAVYQDMQIYLFDDIISAVDTKVARHIFQNCVMGLLRNKTRIFCTHHVQYLTHADRIILMENGTIKQQGKPGEVLHNIDDLLPIDLELGDSLNASTNYESIKLDDEDGDDSVLNEEFRETGTVEFNVYASYWKAVGHMLAISILVSIVLMQASRNLTDWWLSYWVTNSQSNSTKLPTYHLTSEPILYSPNPLYEDKKSLMYYMGVYILFAVMNSVYTLFRAFSFAYGGIKAASKIHRSLLKSIMMAKMTFFDISPLGRILNRFSSDTYTVDDSLPFIMNILLAQFFGLLGSVTITIYGLPWLCLILVPLIPVYHWLQNYYRLTSRELKRLSSITLSPIYNHFNESLQGLVIIRAFRTTQRFKRDNEDCVEVNQKAQLASQAAAQWLGLRLQFMGVAMVTGVVLLAVIQHQFDVADPGLVGLAITYALSITGLLNGVVNAFTETEREMIAVERVKQYIEEVESENFLCIIDPPYAWPSQGVISFQNVVLSYREHLAPSLKGVNFETRPAEKIGVVGRTGAGKSSLLVSLFRLCEISSGTISIDSVNISHISISALRSRLSCIPQDPFLFSGTVRENLDPLKEFRDSELWTALSRVDLTPTIKRLGGLDYKIEAGGVNFSVGQKQLICLARALLRNAKILCVDEATANVDHSTDRQIQCTLRSAFRKSTVITIAHRVQTVLDCDRVLVMGDGVVLEFDNPDVLLEDPTSHFYQLVNNN